MSFLHLPRTTTLPRTRSLNPEEAAIDTEEPKSPFKLEKVSRLCRKHRRGAAAVEFAIIAPVFFLLILGMIEIGRGVMVQQIITNASREGARLAVLPGTTASEVTSRVDDILSASGINGATTQILSENGSPLDPQVAGYGEVIKVVVTVPFSSVSWLPGADKYLAGADLTATTVMRGERVQ